MILQRKSKDARMIGVEKQGDAVRAQVGLLTQQVHAQFNTILRTLEAEFEVEGEGDDDVR